MLMGGRRFFAVDSYLVPITTHSAHLASSVAPWVLATVGLGMTVFTRSSEARPANELSEREREVLDLIASGATNREIAERLFLSPHTIKEHTSSLYRKLGVRNRAEAVQKAQRLGLIS